MKRSPPQETQRPRRRPRPNEVASSDEVLSIIEDCKGKLLEFQNSGTRLAEALTTTKTHKEAHEKIKAVQERVERNLNALEQPLNSVFSFGSAQASNLETPTEDLLDIDDTMGLIPGFVKTPKEAEGEESIPSKLKADYQDLYQSSGSDQVLQKSLMDTKLQLMKSSSEGLHRDSLKLIPIEVADMAAVSTFYKTAFGTETISVSRAQYICLRHESFICYVELSVAGSATPVRVHIHELKGPSTKTTRTLEADPQILGVPSIPVLQEIELLMNEALDWYWERSLKKYLMLEPDERRQQIPGLEVVKCTLLFACTLRGVLHNVSSVATSLSNKPSSPLIGYTNYKLDKQTLELNVAAKVSTRMMFPR